jgi:hypothetical protein
MNAPVQHVQHVQQVQRVQRMKKKAAPGVGAALVI